MLAHTVILNSWLFVHNYLSNQWIIKKSYKNDNILIIKIIKKTRLRLTLTGTVTVSLSSLVFISALFQEQWQWLVCSTQASQDSQSFKFTALASFLWMAMHLMLSCLNCWIKELYPYNSFVGLKADAPSYTHKIKKQSSNDIHTLKSCIVMV